MLHRTEKDSHPGYGGGYLIACTLYASITGESPVGLPNSMMVPVSYDFPFVLRSEGYADNFREIDKSKPVEWTIAADTGRYLQEKTWEAFQKSREKLQSASPAAR
ncbi:MAG: hypothetical protein ACLFUS_09420 [Candidatus Sumerlaeia bacterium]